MIFFIGCGFNNLLFPKPGLEIMILGYTAGTYLIGETEMDHNVYRFGIYNWEQF